MSSAASPATGRIRRRPDRFRRRRLPGRPIAGAGKRRLGVVLALLLGLWTTPLGTMAAAQEGETWTDGRYDLTARVFGTPDDGLVGQATASGYRLGADDRLVGLPACTVSSCPWLSPGNGAGGEWGAQTSCADADGLCWVELTNPTTGACRSAPVLDLGPGFVRDNWWAPEGERTYPLPRGIPAAAAAAEGSDLGFGPGRTDDGYDAKAWQAPAALHVSAATWRDLGLDPTATSAPLGVRLLWQASVRRGDACDGGAVPPWNATTVAGADLRATPDEWAEPVAVLPLGIRVGILGPEAAGYLPVEHGGRRGWVAVDRLLRDDATAATAIAEVNLRAEPSATAAILGVLPTETGLTPTGPEHDGYLPVSSVSGEGWVAVSYVRYR